MVGSGVLVGAAVGWGLGVGVGVAAGLQAPTINASAISTANAGPKIRFLLIVYLLP